MFEKESINQDMLLIGPPSPLRRLLALYFCELTHREAELVVLTRDTTEADLKQRREISGRKSEYSDQAVVRAATEGRVLILEGLERAERNIMPLINNLLENREMSLDDGRFLVSPQRWRGLLDGGSTPASLRHHGLLPVHERFRVIGLSLPVPRYPGLPLDPPLRSRFQGKVVDPMPADVLFECLSAGGVTHKELALKVSEMVGAMTSMEDVSTLDEKKKAEIIDVSPLSLVAYCRVMERFPEQDPLSTFERFYPASLLHGLHSPRYHVLKESFSKKNFSSLLKSHPPKDSSSSSSSSLPIHKTPHDSFISTSEHTALLDQMLKDHSVGQKAFCIVGPRGCGKSSLALSFASSIGLEAEVFPLYRDMLHRELFQRRSTDEEGNTIWEPSPLVTAARNGKVCILDNMETLPQGMLSALSSLLNERMITLFDGTRLLSRESFNAISSEWNLSAKEMNDKGVFEIHPDFAVVAIGSQKTNLKGGVF